MKKVTALLLTLLVLLQCSSKLLLVAEYQLNQDFIAATFCENKALPQLACHGKCHLAKELKKQEEQEKKALSVPSFANEVFLPQAVFEFLPPVIIGRLPGVFTSFYLLGNYLPPLVAILQPPQ